MYILFKFVPTHSIDSVLAQIIVLFVSSLKAYFILLFLAVSVSCLFILVLLTASRFDVLFSYVLLATTSHFFFAITNSNSVVKLFMVSRRKVLAENKISKNLSRL